jgi:hypothetical protein
LKAHMYRLDGRARLIFFDKQGPNLGTVG